MVKYISTKRFLTAFFAIMLISSTPLPFVLASSKSPYESGYDHGCDDAEISDPSDRYINQPEKGPAYHTSEFMNGYDNGFNSCGSSGNYYEPQQSNNDQYSTLNQPSANNQDEITSFCSALQNGNYRAAEGFLTLLGGGSLVAGAEAFCMGWNLGSFLDSQESSN
jgi:hypothetical protein